MISIAVSEKDCYRGLVGNNDWAFLLRWRDTDFAGRADSITEPLHRSAIPWAHCEYRLNGNYAVPFALKRLGVTILIFRDEHTYSRYRRDREGCCQTVGKPFSRPKDQVPATLTETANANTPPPR